MGVDRLNPAVVLHRIPGKLGRVFRRSHSLPGAKDGRSGGQVDWQEEVSFQPWHLVVRLTGFAVVESLAQRQFWLWGTQSVSVPLRGCCGGKKATL